MTVPRTTPILALVQQSVADFKSILQDSNGAGIIFGTHAKKDPLSRVETSICLVLNKNALDSQAHVSEHLVE